MLDWAQIGQIGLNGLKTGRNRPQMAHKGPFDPPKGSGTNFKEKKTVLGPCLSIGWDCDPMAHVRGPMRLQGPKKKGCHIGFAAWAHVDPGMDPSRTLAQTQNPGHMGPNRLKTGQNRPETAQKCPFHPPNGRGPLQAVFIFDRFWAHLAPSSTCNRTLAPGHILDERTTSFICLLHKMRSPFWP